MQTDTEMLIRKLDSIAELADQDRQILSALPLRVSDLQPDRDVLRDGETTGECCLLIEGMMHRYKLLSDGKRQILAFHTPGDIPDLQSFALNVMDHSVAALVRCNPDQFVTTVSAFAAGLLGADRLAPLYPKPRFLYGAVLIGG